MFIIRRFYMLLRASDLNFLFPSYWLYVYGLQSMIMFLLYLIVFPCPQTMDIFDLYVSLSVGPSYQKRHYTGP
ncbi:hypothetical protein MtrunA17_Chr3g0114821 [Medicago truncatula]|uniref:Transmembrane protein n=1 Tax=Medicago truncatula TaxID=3880 RepID=A0A396IVX3_MEDTR|nr:hypothetical protein MtrunA17_Chr3g0114821 [Medicago truncatula]